MQQQQQQMEQQQQQAQAQLEQNQMINEQKLAHDDYQKDLDRINKVEVATIMAEYKGQPVHLDSCRWGMFLILVFPLCK
jgi:hypothetical protein